MSHTAAANMGLLGSLYFSQGLPFGFRSALAVVQRWFSSAKAIEVIRRDTKERISCG